MADFQQSLDINLTCAFITTQAVLPGMIEENFGRIINISLVAAQLGGAIGPHPAAAKAGMIGLTHCYALCWQNMVALRPKPSHLHSSQPIC